MGDCQSFVTLAERQPARLPLIRSPYKPSFPSSNSKVIKVTIALMLISMSVNLNNLIGASFYVIHFTERNVSGEMSGLINSGIGIGYVLTPLLNFVVMVPILTRFNVRLGQNAVLLGSLGSLIAVCLMLSGSQFVSNNVTFAGLCLALRIASGAVAYVATKSLVAAVRLWLPGQFQLIHNFVQGTSCYVGFALGSILGGLIYSEFGFPGPYIFCAIIAAGALVFCLFVLPADDAVIIPEPHKKLNKKLSQECKLMPRRDPLTFLIMLPLLAQMLMNMAGGYLQMMSTPYLRQCCDVSISQGGSYVMVHSITVAIGFAVAGILSQHQVFSFNTQSIVGVILVILGLLIMFPSPTMEDMYTNSHYTGYFAIGLAGIGDPLCSSVTLKYMELIQTQLCGRNITEKQKSRCSVIWLLGWHAGCNVGMFLAALLIKYTTHMWGAWIMSTFCLVGLIIQLVLRLLNTFYRSTLCKKAVSRAAKQNMIVVYNL